MSGSSWATTSDIMQHIAKSADVTNQTILPLDCSAWWGMDQDCVMAIRKIQLDYSQKVAQAAADAYAQISAMKPKT